MTDAELAKRKLRRLDIDPTIEKWVGSWILRPGRCETSSSAPAGQAGRFTMQSKFGIAVSSELMAILSIVQDLKDLRKGWVTSSSPMIRRVSRLRLPTRSGRRHVLCMDEKYGSTPTLMSSTEYQPCLVHRRSVCQHRRGPSPHHRDRVRIEDVRLPMVTESGFLRISLREDSGTSRAG